MKATNEKKSEGYSSPYDFEGRIPLSQAIPLGLQHVMAMFIGNLTPLIIVMGVCGLTADAGFGELRTALLQNAMIIAGVVTLVQMFSIGPVGGKVPIVMGTSSGFLGVLNNTVAACGGGIRARRAWRAPGGGAHAESARTGQAHHHRSYRQEDAPRPRCGHRCGRSLPRRKDARQSYRA